MENYYTGLKKFYEKPILSYMGSFDRDMTSEEQIEQRISFAFGTTAINNPNIIKDLVRRVSESMEK